MGRRTDRRRMTQVSFAGEQISTRTRAETVAVEEPLEIRVAGTSLTVTMRLPGDDMELVHGLLLGEGLIHHRDDLLVARYCADTDTMNVIDVTLADGPRPLPINAQRTLVMHGGCGLCGKASIDAVTASVGAMEIRGEVDVRVVRSLPQKLTQEQQTFGRTGGTHAAGLFTAAGETVVVREDVGRHNAVDKVLGWALINDRDVTDDVLMVSSRASFEIVQKAAMAGVGILSCVSAPSQLAIDAAAETGVTLIAFNRGERLTICSHPERVLIPSSPVHQA
ncbi:formate dehydrogenase accessory sulfurtransferase FdhD [Yimella sp. NH-Cas1]|uniref:formate dehydrogenase accessory sulfurtransferase FdhD n=1 Tax=Yimella sp. NH-Cas1 TaxID=2917726 RepID=UPI0023BAEECD|nr:formate dehydrogenase accessory sulfurtransferase FdhD [Yimella sp. NH-Cas1]